MAGARVAQVHRARCLRSRRGAQKTVDKILKRTADTLESLNRETDSARFLLDACLAVVRNTLRNDSRDAALKQATECRRLVPDVSPSPKTHPASVVGALAEADDKLRRLRVGKLEVTSTPEQGCSVYLQGRHMGTTPFDLSRGAPGEYAVQVECEESKRGRVHRVVLGRDPQKLSVDTVLDRAVVTNKRLRIDYQSEDEQQKYLVSHAARLGRALGVSDVLMVSVLKSGEAELTRVGTRQRRMLARVRVPFKGQRFAKQALSDGIDKLLEGRKEDQVARKLYLEGAELFQRGKYEDALARFEEAHKLSNRPRLLYNMAASADKLRRDEAALGWFESYLEEFPDADNAESVRARIAVLRQTLAERDALQKAAAAKAAEEPAEQPTEQPAAAPEKRRGRLWTYVAAGVTAASIGGTIALGIQTKSEFDRVDQFTKDCADTCTEEEIRDEQDKGRSLQTFTNVAIGVSAAFAAATITLAIFEPTGESEKQTSARLGITPGGLRVEGTF